MTGYVAVVVYGADGSKRYIRGPSAMVGPIIQDVATDTSVDAFLTENTSLEQIGTLADPNVPATATAYETTFPGADRYDYMIP